MARKTTYTADDVAEAALTVLARKGTRAVTARRVAAALGASTAPVYSNFASMDELLEAVRRRILDLILDYCRRPWAPDSFLSMGLGFVHFAIDWPQLFRALYLEPAATGLVEHELLPALLEDLARHPGLGALPEEHREELLFQASIYTLGIATTVVTGRWEDPDFADIEGWLRSVGGLLARAALTSAGLPVPAAMDQNLGKFTVPWRQPGCTAPKDDRHD